MRVHTVPWWRWRATVRSAVHMFSDPVFQEDAWLAGRPEYGTVTDAVYRLVGDTWLDRWSAVRYIDSVFVDEAEALAMDALVVEVLAVLHSVGEDAPAPAYFSHPRWPYVLETARAAHLALSDGDADDADRTPDSLDVLRIRTGGR
jgi:hypothetical protein